MSASYISPKLLTHYGTGFSQSHYVSMQSASDTKSDDDSGFAGPSYERNYGIIPQRVRVSSWSQHRRTISKRETPELVLASGSDHVVNTGAANSLSVELTESVLHIKKLIKDKDLSGAEKETEKLLESSRKEFGASSYEFSIALTLLGEVKFSKRRYQEASVFYREAIKIIEDHFGTESKNLVDPYFKLSLALVKNGYIGEAEINFQRGQNIFLKSKDKDLIQVYADAHTDFVWTCYTDGFEETAFIWLRQSVAVIRKILGDNFKMLALQYWNVASKFENMHRPDDAREMRTKAIPLYAKAAKTDLDWSLENLWGIASAYCHKGDYVISQMALDELTVLVEKPGIDPMVKAKTIGLKGFVSLALDDTISAANYFEQAIAIYDEHSELANKRYIACLEALLDLYEYGERVDDVKRISAKIAKATLLQSYQFSPGET